MNLTFSIFGVFGFITFQAYSYYSANESLKKQALRNFSDIRYWFAMMIICAFAALVSVLLCSDQNSLIWPFVFENINPLNALKATIVGLLSTKLLKLRTLRSLGHSLSIQTVTSEDLKPWKKSRSVFEAISRWQNS